MAKLSNTAVRRAIVTAMEGAAPITALVPAARLYGPQPPAKPTWPFIMYGVALDAPRRSGSCLDGQTIIVPIHSFAKGPGENAAEEIGAAIAETLDGAILPLSAPHSGYARITYTGGRTLRDDADADSWHRVSNFEIRVST